jgi:tRNA(Ile)-lysidine synthetase-like protein
MKNNRKKELIEVKKTQKKVSKAIKSYELIDDHDNILVALSGGIDSLVLLDILVTRQKILPINYSLEAIHIEVENIPEKTDTYYLKKYCEDIGIPLYIESINFKMETDDKKFECFPCSWNRRKAIFQKAEELQSNKIAFGHHMDDTLETLLMNMTEHGEFSAIPPLLDMKKGPFKIIRPLILCSSSEIKQYANIKNITEAERECPYERKSKREIYKEIVQKISTLHPQAKINLFNSMDNLFEEYLPKKPK